MPENTPRHALRFADRIAPFELGRRFYIGHGKSHFAIEGMHFANRSSSPVQIEVKLRTSKTDTGISQKEIDLFYVQVGANTSYNYNTPFFTHGGLEISRQRALGIEGGRQVMGTVVFHGNRALSWGYDFYQAGA